MNEERNEAVVSSNPMDVFGFSSEAVEAVLEKKEKEKLNARDGRICICGHPAKYHKSDSAMNWVCSPGKQPCPCASMRPVIKVPDTRYFLRKSEGNGQLHALSLGIVSCINSKRIGELTREEWIAKIEWIIPNNCDKCGAEDVRIFPTNVTEDGVVMDKPSQFSVLLCEDCRFG